MIELKKIDRAQALRYLGVKNAPDEKTRLLLEKCEGEILSCVSPKYVYRIFKIQPHKRGIKLEGTNVIFTGQDIKNHLDGCDFLAVMSVTLSTDADRLIHKSSVTDIAASVITDALCSALCEQLCDLCQEDIKKTTDKNLTARYSPGYGDFPIEIQKDIIKITDAERIIGLSVNESFMLIPQKSVTAVIGLSDKEIKGTNTGCENCNLKDSCEYRKRGDICDLQ